MFTQDGENSGNISLLEAVEALSEIVELDLESGLGSKSNKILPIDQSNPVESVEKVKATFKVILNFLREHYSKEHRYMFDTHSVEGIKTIMVLVGEAAKKLDRYNALFQSKGVPFRGVQSVTEMNEYKKLQEFYLTRVIKPTVNQNMLSRWILGLGSQVSNKTVDNQSSSIKLVGETVESMSNAETLGQKIHVMDLERVKKDSDYELFFIRRPDGSRYYSPRLLRNVKLVCDFGESLSDIRGVDPIDSIMLWEDRAYQQMASGILGAIRTPLNRFFKEFSLQGEEALFNWVTKSLMALMLSANPANTLKNEPVKCSKEYFHDFQSYLREFLNSRSYQNLIAYPKKIMGPLQQSLLDLIGALLKALYCGAGGYQGLEALFSEVMKEGLVKTPQVGQMSFSTEKFQELPLSFILEKTGAQLNSLVRKHQAGPLAKVLDLIDKDPFAPFDPLAQDNLPESLFRISFNHRDVLVTRMATPVIQEVEDKAVVLEEYRAFLRFSSDDAAPLKILLYNCQNRASWRDFARCECLEELSNGHDFAPILQMLSIPKETEFYSQTGSNLTLNRTDEFFEVLLDNLSDPSKGYFASDGLQGIIQKEEIEGILQGILKLFFSGRNVLTKEAREEFIDIAHLFFMMKCIDAWDADVVSLVSKDGLDAVLGDGGLLFTFFKLMKEGENWIDEDWRELYTVIASPFMLIRERGMHADKFARFVRAFKTLERTYLDQGKAGFVKLLIANLGPYYPNGILNGYIERSRL